MPPRRPLSCAKEPFRPVRPPRSTFLVNIYMSKIYKYRDPSVTYPGMAHTEGMVQDLQDALAEAAHHLDQGLLLSTGERVVWANPAAERLLGRSADELLAMDTQDLLDMVAPEDRAWVEQINRARRKGAGQDAPTSYEATFLRGDRGRGGEGGPGDGGRIELYVTVAPLDGSDLFAVVLRDVTRVRRAEREVERQTVQLERKARETAGLIKAASHDMREPLRMIHSNLQMLQRRIENSLGEALRDALGEDQAGEARTDFELALDGARRLEAFLDDLTLYVEAAERTPDVRPVEADACLDAALEELAGLIEETDAVVEREPLPRLRADPDWTTELFRRLVQNALRFTVDGSPRVHVSASREGDACVLHVRDEGVGIPADQQEAIFLPFHRLHTWNTAPGTGIGLALCARIAEAHGGRIWVESAEDAGATFHVRLPAA